MAMKLNMLPPSVNNMSVQVFVRAVGRCTRRRTISARPARSLPVEVPRRSDADDRERQAPKGVLGESCAVMMYLASREGRDDLYPTDLGRRAMVDAANFYTMSILYPSSRGRRTRA